MPHAPANAESILRYAAPLCTALLAVPAAVDAQTAQATVPCDTRVDSCRAPAKDEVPWLKLKLDRLLSEKHPVSRETTPTFARAQRIEGTVDEKIVLEGNAEIRRGGTVLRGDRITYTQATDEVSVDGNARSRRNSRWSTVFCRSVRPGCPETKINSPSFAPAALHFK